MALKVIIAGGREFRDWKKLYTECDKLIGHDKVEIISGTARGADRLGEQYAAMRGFGVKRFPADWEKNGKAAGYIRNREMGEYADIAIVFWDGKSRGTKHMIDIMNNLHKPVYIINY